MHERFRSERVAGYEISIYLPLSYDEHNEIKRYPVVYVQDAGEVVLSGFNYLDHLVITKQLPEIIFVGIKPQDRNLNYTPWPAPALLSGMPEFGGGAQSYLQVLVEQIKPYVDTNYRTLRDQEHTGIAGCSFGGLLSIYAAYQYPEIFGKYSLISASFWYDQFLDYMRNQGLSNANHRIYMYVGQLEGIYKHNLQRYMVVNTYEAHALLLDKGMAPDQLRLDTNEQGTHDEFFFTQQFITSMMWLFSEGVKRNE